MIHYLTINTTTELICLLIAVFALHKDKNRTWRYFWVYLLITLVIELSSIYLRRHGGTKTTWLYSILTLVEIGFIANMFRTILSTYVQKKIIFNRVAVILYLLFIAETVIYPIIDFTDHTGSIVFSAFYLYFNPFIYLLNVRHNLTNTLVGIMAVLASLTYLYYLLKDDGYVSLKRDSNLWWVVGTLFFYFGFMSINILYDLLKNSYKEPPILFYYTFIALNILFYSLWSYAFICRKWKTRN
jgi:hypothetical protein